MRIIVLIFPHTLFDLESHMPFLDDETCTFIIASSLGSSHVDFHIHVVEDPSFVFDAKYRPCHVHKLKAAFTRATMQAFHARISRPQHLRALQAALQARLQVSAKTAATDKTVEIAMTNENNTTTKVDIVVHPFVPCTQAASFYAGLSQKDAAYLTWPLTDATLSHKLRNVLLRSSVSSGRDPVHQAIPEIRCMRLNHGPESGGRFSDNPMFLLPEAILEKTMPTGQRSVSFTRFYHRTCLPHLQQIYACSSPSPAASWDFRSEKSAACDKNFLTHSTDAANRAPLPVGHGLHESHGLHASHRNEARRAHQYRKILDEAMEFAEQLGSEHPGSSSGLETLAITHEDAAAVLRDFIDTRLENFGTYQDALDPDAVQLFHANIAYLLNCGLLTPVAVLRAVLAQSGIEHRNSVEAFVRQLLGWREYMRAVYVTHGDELRDFFGRAPSAYVYNTTKINTTNNTTKINTSSKSELESGPYSVARRRLPRGWYTAATGIPILDQEIRKALACAWAHHTVRLMVFLNLLLLIDARPAAMLVWFMEMLSLDAYEWVMLSNIAAMGYMGSPTSTRFMRKPYWCSSNYVVVQSNGRYARDAHWDALFHAHLRRMHATGVLDVGGASAYYRNLRKAKVGSRSITDFMTLSKIPKNQRKNPRS